MSRSSPILLIAYGNPARRDDGLGPALAQRLADTPDLEAWWDYQLSVEHASDLSLHDTVIFADASETAPEPFELREVEPRGSHNFSSHILAPEAVVSLARDTFGWTGKAYLLAIRGYEFDPFVESLSRHAVQNLDAAEALVRSLVEKHAPAALR